MLTDLKELGYDNFFKEQYLKIKESSLIPARVVSQKRNSYDVFCEKGIVSTKLSGALRRAAVFKSELPAVGDWVAVSARRDKGYIQYVLERKSCITRKSSGKVFDEQVLSSNIDILFVVTSMNEDFNINRLQRYISLAKSGSVDPVILLSKSDISGDVAPFLEKTGTIASDIPVHTVSVKDPATVEILRGYVKKGVTAAFVGSSGVGKSTLINMMIGSERQKTGAVSESLKKGRHTTSSRELILLEQGGVVIDTPGIRELQVWNDDMETGYEDIEMYAGDCRFFDCNHDTEPECAVKKAVEEGLMLQERLAKWKEHKLEVTELKKMKELAAKIHKKRKTVKKND